MVDILTMTVFRLAFLTNRWQRTQILADDGFSAVDWTLQWPVGVCWYFFCLLGKTDGKKLMASLHLLCVLRCRCESFYCKSGRRKLAETWLARDDMTPTLWIARVVPIDRVDTFANITFEWRHQSQLLESPSEIQNATPGGKKRKVLGAAWVEAALLYLTVCKHHLTAKSTNFQLREQDEKNRFGSEGILRCEKASTNTLAECDGLDTFLIIFQLPSKETKTILVALFSLWHGSKGDEHVRADRLCSEFLI